MPRETECPRTEILEQFLLGQVAQEDADSLDAHIRSCEQCARAMEAVNPVDPVVEAMHDAKTQPSTPSEAAEALIPWLKRLRPKDAAQTISVTAEHAETPPMATVVASYDFLRNPELPDELGRLAQYRVLQSIGAGGMGMVFRAEDIKLKRRVALKVIKPELVQREDLHVRFLNEAQAIAKVEHDNIIVIYEANEVSGVPYIVMPLLQGESLEDLL